MNVLQVRGLCKDFKRPFSEETIRVIDNVDLDVPTGAFMSIVGPSGCGKTTFLRMMNALIKPTAGEIMLDGQPVTEPGPRIGFVFQSSNLYPWRNVLGNVVFGLEVQGAPAAVARERAQRFIDLVGLTGFESYFPYQISGGMQQRVNLARALVIDPEILLMDEPFAALDAQTREIMQAELLRIWRETGKTVLFVTHQIDEAIYLSDRVVVFSRHPGRIRERIDIEITRPRSLKVKRDPAFLRYVDHIWELIEDDVRRAAVEE